MVAYLIERLKEASTWRSILGLLVMFGVALDPEKKDALISFGTSLFFLLGIFLKDNFGEKKEEPIVPTKEEIEVVQAEVEEKIEARKRVKKRETNKKNSAEFLGDD
jgi:hypothetical protein